MELFEKRENSSVSSLSNKSCEIMKYHDYVVDSDLTFSICDGSHPLSILPLRDLNTICLSAFDNHIVKPAFEVNLLLTFKSID